MSDTNHSPDCRCDFCKDNVQGLGSFQHMPDPYEEGKRKREQDAEAFEEEMINKAAAELSQMETIALKPFDWSKDYQPDPHIIEQAEDVVLDEQQEMEWGRATIAFSFEWLAEKLADGSEIDGFTIDYARRIVQIHTYAPGLPVWEEGSTPVQLEAHWLCDEPAIKGVSGMQNANLTEWKDSSGTVLASISSDGTYEQKGKITFTDDELEGFDEAASWEKALWAMFMVSAVVVTMLILMKGMWT